ncbi:MAG: hypothetical protein Q8K30_05930 [Candidatus Gracilibacteria bacterium]|nr:hypothetical protein [Candidatus Gracilibacteria bacterium]
MKTKMKTKIILTLLIISLLGKSVFADDQLDVKNSINYLRGGSIISGLFGDIFTKIFDTEGKLKVTFMSLLSLNDLSDVIVDGNNMFFGDMTGLSNTGNANVGIGNMSLFSNTTGYGNTAIGVETLYENTTGRDNVAIGVAALASNTTGWSNIAIGTIALLYNTTGYLNIAIGDGALEENETGQSNIAMGMSSLRDNISGHANVALGQRSLRNNSTGSYSTAVGHNSLIGCTYCEGNTSLGAFSLYTNSTGSLNTVVGKHAGYNTRGSGNVFIGHQVGYNELGSNKLYIDNSNTSSPLIHGDFATNKLTVNGSLKIGVATDTTCNSSNEGSIRYDSSGKHFYGCDGTTWIQLDN